MKAGAVEFLTKPLNAFALLDAVRHAIEMDREARAERRSLDELRRRHDSLTSRERAVMQKMQADSLITLTLSAKRLGL
jgi:FixJ family two-component response regulator